MQFCTEPLWRKLPHRGARRALLNKQRVARYWQTHKFYGRGYVLPRIRGFRLRTEYHCGCGFFWNMSDRKVAK